MTYSLPSLPEVDSTQMLNTIAAITSLMAGDWDLDGLLAQAVAIVRQGLQTDRVIVYRCLPDHDGAIIAEAVTGGWMPLLGESIYDPCFAGSGDDRYRQGYTSAIDNVQASDLELCYVALLTRLQVQANLVVPILWQGQLWALLIAHHCRSPRVWDSSDRQLMQHGAQQLGQAMYQTQLQRQWQEAQQQLQALPALRHTEQLFNLITANIKPFLFIRDAVSGKFLYVSPAYEQIWQRSCASLYADSNSWLEPIHPDDLPHVHTSLANQFNGNSGMREYRIVRPNGELRWIHASGRVVLDDHNQPSYIVGWAEDYTERKQLHPDLNATQGNLYHRIGQEQLVRTLTARMRETLEFDHILATAADGIRAAFSADRAVIYQLQADGSRRVVQQTVHPDYPVLAEHRPPPGALPPAYLESLRTGQPYLINDVATESWPPAIVEFLAAMAVQSAMVAPIVQNFGAGEEPIWGLLTVHACGRHRQWQPFEANMLQHFADQLAIALHQAELYHQLQAANQKLDQLSKTDGLTQLANRRWLDAYLHQEWQRLIRQQQPLSVILADVDYFKPYNDTYGHAAGDQCLIEIAAAIQQVLKRPADLAARYGGEEFMIVLPDTETQGAIRVVELIRHNLQALAIPHQSSPERHVVTLSFGIATQIPEPGSQVEAIMQAADQALYAAKDQGRDQYQIFFPQEGS